MLPHELSFPWLPAAGRMLFAYQVVVALAAYQLTTALLSELPLNEVRRLRRWARLCSKSSVTLYTSSAPRTRLPDSHSSRQHSVADMHSISCLLRAPARMLASLQVTISSARQVAGQCSPHFNR